MGVRDSLNGYGELGPGPYAKAFLGRVRVNAGFDCYDKGDYFELIKALPGVSSEDVDVTIQRSLKHWVVKITVTGEFSRDYTFVTEQKIDSAKASGKLIHGLLTLRLPKPGSYKAVSIPVTAG